jgi:hypothetical protein
LRNIALAILQYENRHSRFPPAMTGKDGDNDSGYPKKNPRHSVFAYILPFFEEVVLYDAIDFDEHWNLGKNDQVERKTHLGGILICPTAPEARRQVLSTGIVTEHISDHQISDYAPAHRIDFPDAGDEVYGHVVIHPLRNLLGNRISTAIRGMPPGPKWRGILQAFNNLQQGRVTSAHARDGLSHTLMFFEVAGRPEHFVMGWPSPNPKSITSFRWANWKLPVRIDKYCGAETMMNCENSDEVYSFHRSGAGVVMADGSTYFLSEEIAPEVFVALYTLAGGEQHGRLDF